MPLGLYLCCFLPARQAGRGRIFAASLVFAFAGRGRSGTSLCASMCAASLGSQAREPSCSATAVACLTCTSQFAEISGSSLTAALAAACLRSLTAAGWEALGTSLCANILAAALGSQALELSGCSASASLLLAKPPRAGIAPRCMGGCLLLACWGWPSAVGSSLLGAARFLALRLAAAAFLLASSSSSVCTAAPNPAQCLPNPETPSLKQGFSRKSSTSCDGCRARHVGQGLRRSSAADDCCPSRLSFSTRLYQEHYLRGRPPCGLLRLCMERQASQCACI